MEQGSFGSMHPLTFGRTFSYHTSHDSDLLARQTKMLCMLVDKGNCVLVGRNANVISGEFHPLRIFVYADMETRLHDCRERETSGRVDKQRAKTHALLCPWGDIRGYARKE